jgi:tripartite-type tricarboxylate transporter receptor subunit TctC
LYDVAAISTLLRRRPLTAMLLACLAVTGAARAEPVEDFYRGRTLNLVVGYSVGGGYDIHGRLLARHLGKHIPGNPGIIVQNMPGGGSLRSANFLYNAAPKDGSTIGIFSRGMAMEPLIGASNTQYDARKFSWLGSITNEASVCATSSMSKVKTWNDLLATPFTVAGEGSGSDPDIFATMIKNVFGAKLRLVAGYPGSAEMTLAIERGEVDGRCGWTWSSIKLQRPEWIAGHRLNVLVQLASHRIPDLADVPLLTEHATTDRQRQIVSVILGRQVMGRPVVAPPAIPADRKDALRRAFDATMADPEYVAEATARGLEINPVGGADLDKLLGDLYATPPDIIAEVRAIITPGAR